ncbi:hypothetical protein [Streptomyces alanosinicus]|uniref:DUF11 domain-containing protein n=1 Tax=Streptomyces alanosinicus TaxID=68171 RepID=A0A918YJA9_9ACTN|nr:hypothetical protein [Streptomyces alanosinicus]GHE04244.1 hypothetical protein GCM10010339_34900 [Streptomyces alanosinicus]
MPRIRASIVSRVTLVVALCAAGAAPAAADQPRPQPHTKTARPGPPSAVDPSRSDLDIVALSVGGVLPGGTTMLRVLIANFGPDETASTATVRVTVPGGAAAVGPFFPPSCTPDASGGTVVCTFAPGLGLLKTATVQIPVRVPSDIAHGVTLSGGRVAVSSPDDTNSGNNTASFALQVG